jgi:predicted dehydrogenase
MGNWQDKRVLVAGLGSVGQRHVRLLHGMDVKNITIFDVNAASVQKTLETFPGLKPAESYEAGLAEIPDAVFILTPPKLHIPMALAAIGKGVNVFCEKPLADDTEDTDTLRAALQNSPATFAIGLCFRYHPGVISAKQILDSGHLGRLVSIRAFVGEHLPTVRPDYRTLFSSQESGAFDLMHDLDLALWFAGQPMKRIESVSGSFSDIGIKAPDIVEFLIEFEDRCVASVHLDFFLRPRRRVLELFCTEGLITLEFAKWDEYTLSIYSAAEDRWDVNTEKTERDVMFMAEDEAFLKTISGETATVYGVDEALKSLRAVCEARKGRVR